MTTTSPRTATAPAESRRLIDLAIKAAVAPSDLVERPAWPGSTTTWPAPTPLAGLRAAQLVAKMAEQQGHGYALQLRGEGLSWAVLADLMDVGWSDEWSRPGQAFELVAGDSGLGTGWSTPSVYWYCGGPLGCGRHITDRGPYNGHPRDDEDGHAENCRRQAAEIEARNRELEDQERRAAVMDEAYEQLPADSFARDTADRARWVVAHGGQYRGWSTSESLAVALALNDQEALQRHGYPDRGEAIRRVVSGLGNPPADPEVWLSLIRAAATGERGEA